ncbi:MAG: serine protease, partial [Planctomycetales bacterium]|nr:serine protease [Planctomycetales bacterium]
MRLTSLIFFVLFCSIQLTSHADEATSAEDSSEADVRDAVVKVHVSQRSPDFIRPWTKGRSRQTSGSGAVISENRILTNAHVVLYADRVHVQGNQSSKRTLAEIVAVAPAMDLALLKVKDESFFEDKPALEISGDLPRLKDTINVYGFPIGGEQMSVTEGIVSRIECTRLAYSGVGLRLQIDAALNPGNSGGPAIADGKIAGLAFSTITTADNIGYVIAAEELTRFLNSINADGEYAGKPAVYDGTQTTENEVLREWLKLDDDQGGLLVTSPYDPDGPLKELDVITKLGDHEIDRKGYVQVTEDLKLSFQYLVPHLAKEGKVPVTVIRDGTETTLEIRVHADREMLIPVLAGNYPSYFIHGPILFTTPSQEFLKGLRAATMTLAGMESPLVTRSVERPKPGEELVMIG